MKITRIRIGISVISVLIIVLHISFPDLDIDGVTLGLVILAVIPWLAPIFKSLEFPGGWKVEFQDLIKVQNDADKAGLLSPISEQEAMPEYSFQVIAEDDPNLALAGLRIEIEKRLQSIAASQHIRINTRGVGGLMRKLYETGTLSQSEYDVLADMIGLLNAAVHGAEVDKRAVNWAMETGSRLLKSLDSKISD